MLNTVALMGRLTREPELKTAQSGVSFATFGLAVDNGFGENKRTDFFEVVAWRKTGELAATYLQKGALIGLRGRLEQQRWQDDRGNNRSAVKVVAEDITFGEKKKEDPELVPFEGGGELPF